VAAAAAAATSLTSPRSLQSLDSAGSAAERMSSVSGASGSGAGGASFGAAGGGLQTRWSVAGYPAAAARGAQPPMASSARVGAGAGFLWRTLAGPPPRLPAAVRAKPAGGGGAGGGGKRRGGKAPYPPHVYARTPARSFTEALASFDERRWGLFMRALRTGLDEALRTGAWRQAVGAAGGQALSCPRF